MSKLRKLRGHPLSTGGFLSFSVCADVTILLILGYFATHTVRRSGELLGGEAVNVVAWAPVVLVGTVLLVLIPLVAGRLWSQVTTRYTSQGISQWRFLSYRALAWPDIVRVYYDRQGLVLQGRISAIRIIADFYRRPERMLGLVQAQLCCGAEQLPRQHRVHDGSSVLTQKSIDHSGSPAV